MGNLLSYSGLSTKIRAMQSKLLTARQYRELAELKNAPQAVAYLRQQPSYENTWASLSDDELHRGKIEQLLVNSIYDDFAKIDMRIGKIVACDYVEGAEKLLRLSIDLGEGRIRNIFSGIRSAYQPEDLVGKLTVVVANLAPRKMKFGISEGMVMAASQDGDDGIYLLEPLSGAKPGMRLS